MPLNFTLGENEIQIPVTWEELTLEALVGLRQAEDLSNIFSVLSAITGIPKRTWETADLSSFNYNQLWNAIGFLFTTEPPEYKALPMPDAIQYGDKVVTIPKNLNLKSFQQRYEFEQAAFPCIEKTGDIVDVLPELIAIYLQPEYTGKPYDGDNKKPFIDMAKNIPANIAYPVGGFFLKQYYLLVEMKPQPSKKSEPVIRRMRKMPESNDLKSTE